VSASLSIGDFARATHLSIKTLRHYHRVGVLEPADVDPDTGYRRYRTDQLPVAQVIRRFRQLDMPLEDIQAVLAAPDVAARNAVIANHLDRLETSLERTQQATASLRDLLDPHSSVRPAEVEHVGVPATVTAAITDTIEIEDLGSWYNGALGELHATLGAQRVPPAGPAGGIFATELFAEDRGEATVFIPCDPAFRPTGRIAALVIPSAELAVVTHVGSHAEIDRAYGALAAHVANHAIGIDGPIREYYLVDRYTTPDETRWRTQIGWPIFDTGRQ
jgi:DNA-binding transcriptional MerR regulator